MGIVAGEQNNLSPNKYYWENEAPPYNQREFTKFNCLKIVRLAKIIVFL